MLQLNVYDEYLSDLTCLLFYVVCSLVSFCKEEAAIPMKVPRETSTVPWSACAACGLRKASTFWVEFWARHVASAASCELDTSHFKDFFSSLHIIAYSIILYNNTYYIILYMCLSRLAYCKSRPPTEAMALVALEPWAEREEAPLATCGKTPKARHVEARAQAEAQAWVLQARRLELWPILLTLTQFDK